MIVRVFTLFLLHMMGAGSCFECSWLQFRQMLPGNVVPFTSPNYPNNYPPLHKCFAKLTPANTNTTIRLICHDVDLHENTGFFAPLANLLLGNDWVLLATGNVVQGFPSGYASMPNVYSVSGENSLMFAFSTNLFGSGRGFSCTALATDNKPVVRSCGQKGTKRRSIRKRRSIKDIYRIIRQSESLMSSNYSRQIIDLTKIFGGQAAEDNEWPWMAFLSVITSNGEGYCGGTFISSTCILSAAHCFADMVAGTQVTVRYGQSNLANSGVQVTQSAEVVSHPDYRMASTGSQHNDIAIVKLASPVVFNTNVQPICLPTYSDQAIRYTGTGEITGWGKVSDSSLLVTPKLQEAEAQLLDLVKCRERTSNAVSYQQICSDPVTGMSVCPGDSGAPIKVVEKDGRYTQIGLVSYGSSSCQQNGLYAVYTRVDMYLDFISQHCPSATVTT